MHNQKLPPASLALPLRNIFCHFTIYSMLLLCLFSGTLVLQGQARRATELSIPSIPREKVAANYFGADAPWFLSNIPFMEIDDPQIQLIYYYRWKLYRSHIREIGNEGATVTEFLDNVPWGRQPYTDLNDSSSFHLLEGRWMRNPAIIDSLIDHLYSGGGNDRHFSESIAAATWSTTLVTGDRSPAIRHLDSMQYIFNEWNDHFDWSRSLYWIDPISDATEYSIASIDASGAGFTDHPSKNDGDNGFLNGWSFRPSINSYQYANSVAIAEIATAAGQSKVAENYQNRAEKLRAATLAQLWNPDLEHFTDRYQRSTQFVKEGDSIRGRELIGYVPWLYELPLKDASGTAMARAWRHILSSSELAGKYGLRTAEPTYARYMTQYRYDRSTGKPECQWNGPSWPFQTSQTLGALANLLNDYEQTDITRSDYLRLLRQYTLQHFLSPEHPDLQEDYNPDTGRPIVGLARSHHYNHSTYIDLILSGLIGIRPRADNILEVNPLIPPDESSEGRPIRYFLLDNLIYHGHSIKIVYDQTGNHYRITPGLSIFVDGTLTSHTSHLKRVNITLPTQRSGHPQDTRRDIDLAVNPGIPGYPSVTVSSTSTIGSPAEAIDGRLWFFSENPNGWSPTPDAAGNKSWLSIDLGKEQEVSSADLYFFEAQPDYQVPAAVTLEYRSEIGWQPILHLIHEPVQPVANGLTRFSFPAITTREIRIAIEGPTRPATFRLIEAEIFNRK